MPTNGGERPADLQQVPSDLGRTLDVGSDELNQLIADVRLLVSGIQDANAHRPASTTELERTTNNLLSYIDTLPGRIADAIAEALAKQHRMILLDVQLALRDFAGEWSRPPAET